jgi:WD40 repeat protein
MQSLRPGVLAALLLTSLAGSALPAEPGRPGPRLDLFGDPLPPGALARIGTIRLRQGTNADGVVRFAADGKTLLSFNADGIVHRWEVATGREVRRFATTRPGLAYSFSADGGLLISDASASEVGIVVWDLARECEQRRCRFPVRDHIWSVALAPDGKTAAAGTNGKRIIVWDLGSGRPLWERKADSAVRYVICTCGGAVVTRSETGVVSVWDGATGNEQRRLTGRRQGHQGGLAVSPDGTVLAVYGPKGITLYAAGSGAELRRLTDPFPRGTWMQLSRDSRLLLTPSAEGLGLWEVASGRLVHTLPYPYSVTSLDLSPDGKLVALAALGAVSLYDLATGRELHPFKAPKGEIRSLAYTPDGSTLATVGWMAEGNLALWDPATGRRRQVWKSASPQAAFRFAPSGTEVFVPEYTNAIRLHDLRTGKELRRFVLGGLGPQEEYFILAIEPSHDGKTLTGLALDARGGGGILRTTLRVTWDVATARELSRVPFTASLDRYALAPGGRLLAVLEFRPAPALCLIEMETGHELGRLEPGAAIERPLIFSPDGTLLAVLGSHQLPGPGNRSNRSVAVWEVATGQLVCRVGPSGVGRRVAFSADGRLLATGSAPIQLWDLATGMEIGRWYGQSAHVNALDFAPENARLATGLWDGTALIWDIAPAVRRMRELMAVPGAAHLDHLWDDLAGTDARKAQAAIGALAAAPDLALELFGRRLRPVVVNREHIPHLISQLDSKRYAEREAATRQLEALGLDASPQLRKVLDERPPLELRRRVDALLAIVHTVRPPRTAEERRRVRAVRVLETVGSPEARRLLAMLAEGPGDAEETWQAKAALERLAARARMQAARRS